MIERMHHTGFVVRDIDKAVEFYSGVIGLEVQSRYERAGAGIDQVIGYDGAHLRIALLGAPGGEHMFELIQYLNPLSGERPTEERSVLGGSHLGFLVDDIGAAFDRIAASDARILNPPTDVAPGRTACYLQDPDGNWIELIQIQEE